MIEIKKKSVIPIYGTAAVWALYCLLFPLYSWLHFAILMLLAVISYFTLSKIFPGTTEYVEIPAEPLKTGDEKIDKLLDEGHAAIAEMKRLKLSISESGIKSKIDELIIITDKIFLDLFEDPSDYSQIKRFSNYYIPTTLKLLNSYDRMYSQGIEGDNITSTLKRIDSILDTTILAYKKQLDSLFANQALDIETDITVMENMLKREGLSGKDF